ncbi:UPF0051 protein SSP1857 [Acidimicrobiaceae bacterium]|nr:UPF0051 protein SSP1857 [Acidimicrobiaceae bacterium]
MGPKATGEVLSVAYAGAGQHQDAGAKMVHAHPRRLQKLFQSRYPKTAESPHIAVWFVSNKVRQTARAMCSATR